MSKLSSKVRISRLEAISALVYLVIAQLFICLLNIPLTNASRNSLRTYGEPKFENITWELYRFLVRPEIIIPPWDETIYTMTDISLDRILSDSETIMAVYSWEYDKNHSYVHRDPPIAQEHQCGYIIHSVKLSGQNRFLKLPCPDFPGAVLNETGKYDFERNDLKLVERERYPNGGGLPIFLSVREDDQYVNWHLTNNTLEEISFINGTVTKMTDVLKILQMTSFRYVIQTNDNKLYLECDKSFQLISTDVEVVGNSVDLNMFYYTKKGENSNVYAVSITNTTSCEIFTGVITVEGINQNEHVTKIDSELIITSNGRFFARKSNFETVPNAIGEIYLTLEVANLREPAQAYLVNKMDNRAYTFEFTQDVNKPIDKVQGKYSRLSFMNYGYGPNYFGNGFFVVDAVSCFDILVDDPAVCSGHGICTSVNLCSCSRGYYGDQCEKSSICGGIPSVDSSVCSSHGICKDSNCICQNDYVGPNCALKNIEQAAIISSSVFIGLMLILFICCCIVISGCCCFLVLLFIRRRLIRKRFQDRGIDSEKGWIPMEDLQETNSTPMLQNTDENLNIDDEQDIVNNESEIENDDIIEDNLFTLE